MESTETGNQDGSLQNIEIADFIAEDYKIRKNLKKELFYAGVSNIIIERTVKKLRINIVTARPGIIIGKKGVDIEKLKATLIKMLGKDVALNIKEEKRPQASAQLAAENVATQLERRTAFRRAMKKVIQGALKSGAKGIKSFSIRTSLVVLRWLELSGT